MTSPACTSNTYLVDLQSNALFSSRRLALQSHRQEGMSAASSSSSLLVAAHAMAVHHDLVYVRPQQPHEELHSPVSSVDANVLNVNEFHRRCST
jgi:hypothetical protein